MSKELISLNADKPLLTISLLTSNRKETIGKCLDSLTHLRKTVSSELIIVDTGCNEEMRNIIEEYTDRIHKFEWCDDFAKARNVSVKAARGEWYMFLDDDEWFEDTAEIERFFSKGHYKEYDACFYIQRNYNDMSGLSYSDDPVSRMMKLTPEVKFVGIIHEYLDPFQGVYTCVKSYVHHYGYVFKNKEEKYRHSLRNVSLLQKMIKEEPGQIRWWLQMAQEYNAIDEFSQMHDICEKGLTVFTREKTGMDKYLRRDVAGLYLGMIEAEVRTFKFKQAIEDGKKALKDERLWPMAVAAVHLEMANSYEKLGQYAEMKDSCLKYLRIYDEMHDDEKEVLEQACFMVDETFTRKYHEMACWLMMIDAMDRDDIVQLREYFEQVIWNEKALFVYNPERVQDIIRCIARNEFDIWFITAATNIASRADHVNKVCRLINEYEKKDDLTEFNRLVRVFSFINIQTYYLDYLKVLAYNVKGSQTLSDGELYPTVERTFAEIADCLSFKKEYWEILKEHNVDIKKLFRGIGYDTWRLGVDTFCTDCGTAELSYITDMIDEISPRQEEDRDIRFDYYDMRALEATMMMGAGRSDYDQLKDLLGQYASDTLTFYERLYKPEAFINLTDALPDDCRVALKIDKGLKAEADGNYREALTVYKSAIGIRHNLNDILQDYSHLYAEKIKESMPARDEKPEMDERAKLEWQIRLRARQLEQMGHKEEAEKILEQLDTLIGK